MKTLISLRIAPNPQKNPTVPPSDPQAPLSQPEHDYRIRNAQLQAITGKSRKMNTVTTRAGTDAFSLARAEALITKIVTAKVYSLQLRLGAAARAHERRRAYESVGPDTMRDVSLVPELATGAASWQADLPFFMQSGFGRR
jgi:hypothetical protein